MQTPSKNTMPSSVILTLDPRGVATVMLNRPDKHNALDPEMLRGLLDNFAQLASDTDVRAVVLTGAGKSFCAGADLAHMQRMSEATESENYSDAMLVSRCMRTIDEFSKPVIARVNGNAFGGGVGLIACCDMAVATSAAKYTLSEVKLGLVAAVISPYLIAALGQRHTRRLLLTAKTFDAAEALSMGLIYQHVDEQELDKAVEQQIELLLQGGTQAQQTTKRLLREVGYFTPEDRDMMAARTAKALAKLRKSEEGSEGIQAFLQKRKPNWCP
jgi:methylglutaconyl-CoA hydratase